MTKIIEFPTHKIKVQKRIEELIKKSFPHDPDSAQKFRDLTGEIYTLYENINSKKRDFSFTAEGDSIEANVDALSRAVNELTDNYHRIINDLFEQIVALKVENCKIRLKLK